MPQQVTASITFTVIGALTITNPTPANPVQGQAYSHQFAATGGTAPYTWEPKDAAGNVVPLPAGLSLSSAGLLSGTPTAAGAVSFSVRVTDSGA